MDDQHAILMDTINELRLALVHGCGQEKVSEHLDRLIEFTRMHFWSEEKLMEQSGFPDLARHRTEHHRMLAKLQQSSHSLQHGEGPQMRAMLRALRNGYIEHIERLDRKYGPWLNERGVF
jgi:hemerythrin-like metal-binding protein